jgi:hypothetical protein
MVILRAKLHHAVATLPAARRDLPPRSCACRSPVRLRRKLVAGTLALAIAACAAPGGEMRSDALQASQTSGALDWIAAPFYIAFRLSTCVLAAALTAPVAGAVMLSNDAASQVQLQELDDGLSRACGLP